MRVTTLKPMVTDPKQIHVDENGCFNPFHQDGYHMGTSLGRNILAMQPNFPEGECEYLILVNTRTGERIKIEIEGKCSGCGEISYLVHSRVTENGTQEMCETCWGNIRLRA